MADRGLGASAMIAGLLAFVAGPLGRWIVIGLLIAATVTAAGLRLYNAGYDKRDAEISAEIAEANQGARIAERAASERMAKVATDHQKEKSDAQAQTDRLRTDLRSGARRLSVPAGSCVPASEDSGPSGRPGAEARTELATEVAEALVAIAGDGDAAIRQANALIDAYQVAAEVCGK